MELVEVPAESRKQAACVLEVLAGVRTPEQAAQALGVSVPTYYNLETRALRGLVHGCTPEPPGRKSALQKRLRESEARYAQLERQLQRYQALLRSAQRTAALPPVATPRRDADAKSGGRKRRSRKPRVRALRAIEALQQGSGTSSDGPTAPATESP